MRFAIWVAVSTGEQAGPDKASLSEQEKKCRAAGQGKGWVETSAPFVVTHTRSFYVNLSDAERDIPALKQMLDAARDDRFDVLIVATYDRLGDLVDMIAQSLRFYAKQLYSVSQAVEPQDPERYDPYATEAEAIMRDAARITQRFRINDLRRKRAELIPRRIQRGLPPARVPFGYRWTGKKSPPDLDEQCAELVVRMKDMFLRGEPVAEIMRYADGTGIQTPNGKERWQDSSIRAILTNPFYAGFVTINRFSTIRDPRNNRVKQIKLPKSKWKMERGLHTSLWDEPTYKLLVAEMQNRHQSHIHHRVRYPFAGLLYCECGEKLIRVSHGHSKPRARFWVCSTGRSSHFIAPYDVCADIVAGELAKEFEQLRREPDKPVDVDGYKRSITDLENRKARIQEGYELGGYDKFVFAKKMNEIDGKIEELREKVSRNEQAAILREQFLQFMGIRYDSFPLWLKQTNAAAVNLVLRAVFEKIVVHPDLQVEFKDR